MLSRIKSLVAVASTLASLVGCGCDGSELDSATATAQIAAGETSAELPLTLAVDDPGAGFELHIMREDCVDDITLSVRSEDGSVLFQTGACGMRRFVSEDLGARPELRIVLTRSAPAAAATSHAVSVTTYDPVCAGESAARVESFGG